MSAKPSHDDYMESTSDCNNEMRDEQAIPEPIVNGEGCFGFVKTSKICEQKGSMRLLLLILRYNNICPTCSGSRDRISGVSSGALCDSFEPG